MPWDWLLTKEPKPIKAKDHKTLAPWTISHTEPLVRDFLAPSKDFLGILESRRTNRDFGCIDESVLSGVFWFTLRTQALLDDKGTHFYRPVPSAGATHAISIIVIQPDGIIWRYDGGTHSKQFIHCNNTMEVYQSCKQVIDPQSGCLLILAAEIERISPYYDNFESLIWRDAGVILEALALTAEAFDVNFCPLGISGDDWLKDIFISTKQTIRGVGVALIGSR